MFDLREKGSLSGNIGYAVLAQFVALTSGLLMSLVVPKYIGVGEYSYWQLFIMYIGYMGIFLFGVHDGAFLRFGGERIEDANFSRIKSEYLVVLIIQAAMASVSVLLILAATDDQMRRSIMLLVCLCAFIANPAAFMFYVFRSMNLPRIFSSGTMIAQAGYILFLLFAVVSGIDNSLTFCSCYIICQSFSACYCYLHARPILKSNAAGIKQGIEDMCLDLRAGIKVTLAYYAGALVIGAGRMMIDANWGIEAFGIFSFSVSLVNFLLSFMAQASMVIFPVVKRMGGDRSKEAFLLIKRMLMTCLPLVYLLYFPACVLLGWWLPQYSDSLRYLAILLPVCVFDSKTQLLTNTYLKAMRKENLLLYINAGSLVVAVLLMLTTVFVMNNIVATALMMVVAIALRNMVAELYLSRAIGCRCEKVTICEAVLSFAFIYGAYQLNSLVFVVVSVFLFYLINVKEVRNAFRDVMTIVRSQD